MLECFTYVYVYTIKRVPGIPIILYLSIEKGTATYVL